ncbi:DNase I-like protein [Viridothelium virens]|uniref:DNase I-like protein n=1 Tax=Viridothelium virens TaxID=1048519 RepID=A0A6A6H317_VIRVR|nr:DNase I-like protein [Viridothelium virens]
MVVSEASGTSTEPTAQAIPGAYPDTSWTREYQTLSQAVHARRAEYTTQSKVRVKVGTWNVASLKGTEKDIGGWFVGGKGVTESLAGLSVSRTQGSQGESSPGSEETHPRESVVEQEERLSRKDSTIPRNDAGSLPHDAEVGIYALGLQEVIDINSATEALKPYTDTTAANKWKKAVEEALPQGYQLIAEQQLIGLLLLVYASPQLAPEIRNVCTTSVGTGLMGYMGNKGAVTARIVLGETTRMVFVNSHLSAGADKAALDRRDWDASQIVSRTRFDSISDPITGQQAKTEAIGDEDFAFWFGDLNYRLEGIPGEDVRRLLMLHTRNEYDLSGSSVSKIEDELARPGSTSELDPASLQATLASLLPHDELHQRQRAHKAFHEGWREGEIKFLPTYKYDVGSVGVFDSSEKKRAPSWCDRILYRTRRDKLGYENRKAEEEAAQKRDEQLKAEGIITAAADEDTLFEYNPDTDGDYDEDDGDEDDALKADVVLTRAGFQDEMTLDYYTAHQRVLSSDHKPLDAIFTLKYDAVVPELKSKVYSEVAKELDKAENEGRPTISVVIDRKTSGEDGLIQESSTSDAENVDFGDIRYGQAKCRTVTIANTGRVPASIGFIDRPIGVGQKEGTAPEWLLIRYDDEHDQKFSTPSKECRDLEPGDACTIELLVHICSFDVVRRLNEGLESIDDILVLRVRDGRDHFITVRGQWLPSSFGRSVDKLIRIPEGGIRKLQHQRPKGSSRKEHTAPINEENPSLSSPVMWSAPRELFRLTEAIEDLAERAVADWSMKGADRDEDASPWQNHVGWPFARDSWTLEDGSTRDDLKFNIREALDNDQPFDQYISAETTVLQRLETLAETLLEFLGGLEDGIVSEDSWFHLESGILVQAKAKQPLSQEDEKGWVLETLSDSPSRSVSFVLLMSTLARIASEVSSSEPAGTLPSPLKDAGLLLPSSPTKSTTGEQESPSAHRSKVNRAFAEIFSRLIINAPLPSKSKERKTQEERLARIFELFLDDGNQT